MANTVTTMKRNDTGPPAVMTVMDGDTAKSLIGADTVTLFVGTLNSTNVSTIRVQRSATIVNAAAGLISVDWADGDFPAVGTYKAEVEVMWSTGLRQTFPAAGYLTITITADLGDVL